MANSWRSAHNEPEYFFRGEKSLAGIALRAFALGAAATLGLVATIVALRSTPPPSPPSPASQPSPSPSPDPLWRLPFFLAALSTFHFLEFWTTAAYNTPAAGVDSFLLTSNWPAYQVAHAASAVECAITNYLWPQRRWLPAPVGGALLALGLALVVAGQAVRSAAMARAGVSFNHQVQSYKAETHRLVTTGVYGVLRHPSYFGFFWWGIGIQLVLGNVACLVAYAVVMWRFFARRVPVEEAYLVRFFGREYVEYKRRVPTLIPFIP